jgi:hypothetical protein
MENIINHCEKELNGNYNLNGRKNSIINECIIKKTENIKKDLDNKLIKIKKNKFTRYFTKHKGRTLIIISIIIFLIICLYFNYPISGDFNDDSNFESKLLSLFGFISSNLLLALLVSVIGVETFLSREELSEFRNEEKKLGMTVLLNARNKFKNANKNKIKKIKDLINKFNMQPQTINKYEVKSNINTISVGKNENISNIYIDPNDISYQFNDDNDNSNINNYFDIIESSIKYDISLNEDEILEIIDELNNLIKEIE